MLRTLLCCCLGVAFASLACAKAQAEPPLVEAYLIDGKLTDGAKTLQQRLRDQPTDDEARFGLGVLQFVQAVEHLGQSLHEHGAIGSKTRLGERLPILRVAVPDNPQPKEIAYKDVRRILQRLVDDLAVAERTLADVKDEKVKLPLHMAKLRMDLNGDDVKDESESLWKLYAQLNQGGGLPEAFTPKQADAFVIGFDYADAIWLRGYCHLLSAMCETVLMYDEEQAFNAIAPHVFSKPVVQRIPADFFRDERFVSDIADAIAFIHLMRFPVVEPKRGEAALNHLREVIQLSQKNWDAIEAETDNDNEWVPNPKQTGVIPGVSVTPAMIKTWREFLTEAEQIVEGKKLIEHWRLHPERGVNLKKVYLEPREFDAVMWLHGAGVMPFLEKGECSSPETWRRFNEVFGGRFIGFAFWFN